MLGFFGIFANNFVCVIVETQPVASPFNTETMKFLIIGNIRKESKNGTMLWKIEKIRNIRHLRCQISGTLSRFSPKLCFECPTVSTLISKEIPFYKHFSGLNRNWDFVRKHAFGVGAFEANSNKKLRLYLQKRILGTGNSHC